MNATPIAPAPTREEIDAALAAAAIMAGAGAAPLLVAAGRPLRIVFATPAASALLRADSLESLGQALLVDTGAAGQRLADALARLEPGGSGRLERLRIAIGPSVETITFHLRRLPGPTAASALTAVGVRPSLLANPPVVDCLRLPPAASPAGMAQSARQASSQGVLPRSLDEVRADLAVRFGAMSTVRFLWQTDAEGRFVTITNHLCEVVGCMTQALVGDSFLAIADRLGLDPEGHLTAALARRDTWSGVDLAWPVRDAAAILPVTVGALPAFGPDRQFDGFRGFGVIHLDRLREPPVPAVSAEVAAPEIDVIDPIQQVPEAQPVRTTAALVAETRAEVTSYGENVVRLRTAGGGSRGLGRGSSAAPAEFGLAPSESVELSPGERLAFKEIARALGARGADDRSEGAETPGPARDLIDYVTRASGTLGLGDLPAAEPPAEPAHEPAHEPATPVVAHIEPLAPPILDQLPFGLLILDGARIAFANRTLLDYVGAADTAALEAAGGLSLLFRGRDPADLVPLGGPVPVTTLAGDTLTLDLRLGEAMWHEVPTRLVVLTRNIPTALPRVDQAEAQELRALLDTTADGIMVLDRNGDILSLNRAARLAFGYDAPELAGRSFAHLFAPDSQPTVLAHIARALASPAAAAAIEFGADGDMEILGRTRQGEALSVHVRLERLAGPSETPRLAAVLRDLAPWRRAERELRDARREAERASALKSEFLAKVSHEIRTPLNAILGFAEVIMDERFGPVGNERYRDYLKDIHASGTHVMSLVNDLLDLSKIEAGRMDLASAPVDVNRIVTECVSLMQPQANSERVIMRTSLAQRLPQVMADERSLRQIVLNVLSNAVKFNEPGGQVIVSTAVNDAKQIVLRVRDTGIGMSEADLQVALEPFRQVATSRGGGKVSGTGLGLPLTKALVEANRATFTIRSRKQEGTLVEVAFPAGSAVAG